MLTDKMIHRLSGYYGFAARPSAQLQAQRSALEACGALIDAKALSVIIREIRGFPLFFRS
jgi:hypothetical protein